jgi:hypothetical protein
VHREGMIFTFLKFTFGYVESFSSYFRSFVVVADFICFCVLSTDTILYTPHTQI